MGIEEWQEYIYQIEYTIGYFFKNKFLLYQAFTRSSYSNQYGVENNEVLEFIGDSVLSFCVVQLMAEEFGFLKSASQYYNKYEDLEEYCLIANKNESDFTDLKNQIVSNKTLAKKINKLGFAKYLVLGDNDKRNNVANQDSVKADLFEAIIGAIAIDSGWDIKRLKNIIIKMLDIEHFFRDVDCREKRPDKFKLENAINTLKELAERGECSMPIYQISEKPIIDNNGKHDDIADVMLILEIFNEWAYGLNTQKDMAHQKNLLKKWQHTLCFVIIMDCRMNIKIRSKLWMAKIIK